MFRLEVETVFAAAHQLRGYQGKCERLHGHNWRVRAAISAEQVDERGIVMDFALLRERLHQCTAALDHRLLNEISPFNRINPTSENVAHFLAERLAELLPEGVQVAEVAVWESDNCAAIYAPPKAKEI